MTRVLQPEGLSMLEKRKIEAEIRRVGRRRPFVVRRAGGVNVNW